MPGSSILETSAAYACAGACRYSLVPVAHAPLRAFCSALDRLKARMRDAVVDDYWQTYLGGLSLSRYLAITTPLPFNHPLIYGQRPADTLRQSISQCHTVFPTLAAEAHALLDQYETLGTMGDNPLIDAIVYALDDCSATDKVGVVLARGRYAEHVDALLRERIRAHEEEYGGYSEEGESIGSTLGVALQNYLSDHVARCEVEVITPAHLRSTETYSRLLVVGVVFYFGDYVFSAPRTRRLVALQYDWIRSGWKYQPPFEGGIPRLIGRRVLEAPPAPTADARDDIPTSATPDTSISGAGGATGPVVPDEFGYDGRELEEAFDRITSRMATVITGGQLLPGFDNEPAGKRDQGAGELQESVPAVLLLLEDGVGVFLEVGTGAEGKATVVDVEREAAPVVDTIPVTDVEAGMFVLLRTQGGGDFVVPVADSILAGDATRLRSVQRQWKARLRQEVARYGMQYAVSSLRQYGAQRATEPNIRNWMSPRNIRTQDYADFKAIMRFAGMSTQAESMWADMDTIFRAHRDAGWEIRRLLDAEVRKADLRRLRTLGRMDFRLPAAASGSLSLLRIEHVSKKPVRVPASRIAHLFQVPAREYAMHLMAGGGRR